MLISLGVKLAKFLLKKGNLNEEQSLLLTTEILDRLHLLPFSAIIEVDSEQQLLINGNPVSREKAMVLRESAKAMLDSQAMKLVRDQTAFIATNIGLPKAETITQVLFARAALWFGQEELRQLHILAERLQEPEVIQDL